MEITPIDKIINKFNKQSNRPFSTSKITMMNCKAYSYRLTENVCIRRQSIMATKLRPDLSRKEINRFGGYNFIECINCKQGKEIQTKHGVDVSTDKAHLPYKRRATMKDPNLRPGGMTRINTKG